MLDLVPNVFPSKETGRVAVGPGDRETRRRRQMS